jgi:hypothetical protein
MDGAACRRRPGTGTDVRLRGEGRRIDRNRERHRRSPLEIKAGKIGGEAVSFWVQSEYQGQAVKLMYQGQVSGDEIRFKMSNEEGNWSTDPVVRKGS